MLWDKLTLFQFCNPSTLYQDDHPHEFYIEVATNETYQWQTTRFNAGQFLL